MNDKKYVVCSYDENGSVSFINTDKKHPQITKYIKQARIFENHNKGSLFISNLPKTMRINKVWILQEVIINNKNLELKNTLKSKHYNTPIKNSIKKDNDYYEDIKKLNSKIENLKVSLSELENQQKIIELKVNDYQHYMEFNKLSASLGYCAYSEFRELLIERRNIKNEIARINVLLKLFNNDIDFSSMENKLQQIDKQKYSPRILFDLFK